MAVLQPMHAAPDQRDHLRPLDSVLCALQEAECAWCRSILALLRRHLEEYIPVFHEELN